MFTERYFNHAVQVYTQALPHSSQSLHYICAKLHKNLHQRILCSSIQYFYIFPVLVHLVPFTSIFFYVSPLDCVYLICIGQSSISAPRVGTARTAAYPTGVRHAAYLGEAIACSKLDAGRTNDRNGRATTDVSDTDRTELKLKID